MKTDRLPGRDGTARVSSGVGVIDVTPAVAGDGAGSIAVDSVWMAGTGVLCGSGPLQAAKDIPDKRAAIAISTFIFLPNNAM